MSYEFMSFSPVSGEDPKTTKDRLTEQQEMEAKATDPAPQVEARMKMLADAIMSCNPQITPFALQHDQIAELEHIIIEEANNKFRYIELNSPDEGNGIQITLQDDHATITVPYWHQGEKANAVFKEIWKYLRIFQDKGGYITHDPQLERIIDLDHDFKAAISQYENVSQQVNEPFSAKTKKPWWRFW